MRTTWLGSTPWRSKPASRALRCSADRQLSKPRLCQRLGAFEPASAHQLEATRRAILRYSPVPAIVPQSLWKEYEQSLGQARLERKHSWSGYRHIATSERQHLKGKYRRQRAFIAALPISGADKKRLSQQLSLRLAIDSRVLKHKLTRQRAAIHKITHPGTSDRVRRRKASFPLAPVSEPRC